MSEQNIEQMMEMLRESGEIHPDFEKKSQEIINNFKDKKIQQFLAAFCLTSENPYKKKFFQKKSDNPVAKLLKLAHEEFKKDEWEYFDRMRNLLSRSDEFYESFPKRCGIGSIFQAYLDEKVILPNINEFQDLQRIEKYQGFLIIPNVDLAELVLQFHEKLKGIADMGVDMPEENGSRWVEDERPSGFYTIGLPEGTKSSCNAFFSYIQPESSSPQQNEANRQTEQNLLWPDGNCGRAFVRGLTLREYLIVQLKSLYTFDRFRKDFSQKPINPKSEWLFDKHQAVVNNRALLLGWHKISKDNKHEAYLAASWKPDYKNFVLESDRYDGYSYFPWFSVAFDEFRGGSNE